MRAGELKVITQEMHQQKPGLDLTNVLRPFTVSAICMSDHPARGQPQRPDSELTGEMTFVPTDHADRPRIAVSSRNRPASVTAPPTPAHHARSLRLGSDKPEAPNAVNPIPA